MRMSALLVAVVVGLAIETHGSPSCCGLAATNRCRNYCQQMDWTRLAQPPVAGEKAAESPAARHWKDLSTHCPPHMQERLWKCLLPASANETGDETLGASRWVGRQCCSFSPVRSCEAACERANAASDLGAGVCRRSDNIRMFECLSTLQEGESCCHMAPEGSGRQCRDACWTLYAAKATATGGAGGINGTLRQAVHSACTRWSQVVTCAKSLLRVERVTSPATTLQCCDKGGTAQCRQACERSLKSRRNSQEVLEALEKDCGTVDLPGNALWQCLLRLSPAGGSGPAAHRPAASDNGIKLTKQRSLAEMRATSARRRPISFDSAKLSCCDRGTAECNALCRRIYTQDWDEEYDSMDCLQSPNESELSACIKDVDEPCQPGCSNLSFCTNFNHRPMELFRNCNPEADKAAENMFSEWLKLPHVLLPGWDQLVMSGPSKCMPTVWKALACALQFQPCKRNMARMTICPKDCIELLSSCLLERNQTLAIELCDRLTPRAGHCVSLQSYLTPQPPTVAMISPCKFNNCDSQHVCVVDHGTSEGYSCLTGCQFGETSKMYGYPKTWLQLPAADADCPINSCNEVCYCAPNGQLRQCTNLPFQQFQACSVNGQTYEHGTRFQIECNLCVCHFGESVCSKYHCDYTESSNPVVWSCPLQPELICSASGRRYLNVCFGQLRTQPPEELRSCATNGSATELADEDSTFEPECYTVLKLVYSIKQVDWLLKNTNNVSLFSIDQVEQSLRYLLTYSHCRVRLFHSVEGELVAVIYSQLHCTSCTAEAEKLVLLFEQRSPQVTLNVHLSVILLAEIVQFIQLNPIEELPRSQANTLTQSNYIIPSIVLVAFIYALQIQM